MAVYRRRQEGRQQGSMFDSVLSYMMQRAMMDAGMRERTAETRVENERVRNMDLANSIAGQVQQYIVSNFIPPEEADRLMAEARQQFAGMDPSIAQRFDMVSGALPSPSVDDIASNAMASMPPFPGESRDDWYARLEASGVAAFAGLGAPLTSETTSMSPLHIATRALGDKYIGASDKSMRGVLERESAQQVPESGYAIGMGQNNEQTIYGGTWSHSPAFEGESGQVKWEWKFTPSTYHNMPQEEIGRQNFIRIDEASVRQRRSEGAGTGGAVQGLLGAAGAPPEVAQFAGEGTAAGPTIHGAWTDVPEEVALNFDEISDDPYEFVGSNWSNPEAVIQMAQEMTDRFDALPPAAQNNLSEQESQDLALLNNIAGGEPIEGGIAWGGGPSFEEEVGGEAPPRQTFMLNDPAGERLSAHVANLFSHPAFEAVEGSEAVGDLPPIYREYDPETPDAPVQLAPGVTPGSLQSPSDTFDYGRRFPQGKLPSATPGQESSPYRHGEGPLRNWPLPSQIFDSPPLSNPNLQEQDISHLNEDTTRRVDKWPAVPPLEDRQELREKVQEDLAHAQAQGGLSFEHAIGMGVVPKPVQPPLENPILPHEQWLNEFAPDREAIPDFDVDTFRREERNIGKATPHSIFKEGDEWKSGTIPSLRPEVGRRGSVSGPSIDSIVGGAPPVPRRKPTGMMQDRPLLPRTRAGEDMVKFPTRSALQAPLTQGMPPQVRAGGGPPGLPPSVSMRGAPPSIDRKTLPPIPPPVNAPRPRALTPNLGPQAGTVPGVGMPPATSVTPQETFAAPKVGALAPNLGPRTGTVPGVRMPPATNVTTQESFRAEPPPSAPPTAPSVPPPIPSITAGGPPQIPLRDRGTIGTPNPAIRAPGSIEAMRPVGETPEDRQKVMDEAMRPPPGDPITRGPRDISLADRGTIGTPMQPPPTGKVDVTEGPFRAGPPPATPAQGDWPLPPIPPPIRGPEPLLGGAPGSQLGATGYQQGHRPSVDPTLPVGEIVGDQIQKYMAGISPEESRALHSVLMNMVQGESSGRAYDESGRVLEGDSNYRIDGKPAPSKGLMQLGPQARGEVGADDLNMGIPAGQIQAGISYLLNLIGGSQRPDWKGGPSEGGGETTFGAKQGITSIRDALAAYNTGPGTFRGRNRRFEAGTPSLDEGGGIAQGEYTPESPYGPSSDYVQKALRGLSPEDEALINQYIQRFQQGL